MLNILSVTSASVLSSEGGPNSSEDGDDGAAIVDVSAQRLSDECTHLVVGARLRKTEKVRMFLQTQLIEH